VGETKTVTFQLTSQDLSFIGISLERISEPGDFIASVGGLSQGFQLV